MKGIKKYTTSFAVTQQLAKEKLGKASNSVDSEEIRYIKEQLHLIKWALKNIKVTGQDYTDHVNTWADKGSALENVLATMGEGSLQDTELGAALVALAGSMKEEVTQTRAVLIQSTADNLITPLAKAYEVDAKVAIECKERQEMARLTYESAQAKVADAQKGGKKLHEAEQKLAEARSAYENLSQELTGQCQSLIAKLNANLMPHVKAYVSAQAAYHAKLAEEWRATEVRILQHQGAAPAHALPHPPYNPAPTHTLPQAPVHLHPNPNPIYQNPQMYSSPGMHTPYSDQSYEPPQERESQPLPYAQHSAPVYPPASAPPPDARPFGDSPQPHYPATNDPFQHDAAAQQNPFGNVYSK